MKRWPMIIVAFFVVLFIANGFLVYFAVSGQDQVVESYANTQNR